MTVENKQVFEGDVFGGVAGRDYHNNQFSIFFNEKKQPIEQFEDDQLKSMLLVERRRRRASLQRYWLDKWMLALIMLLFVMGGLAAAMVVHLRSPLPIVGVLAPYLIYFAIGAGLLAWVLSMAHEKTRRVESSILTNSESKIDAIEHVLAVRKALANEFKS